MIEEILVGAIVLASVAYAIWLIRQSLKRKTNPCNNCQGCPLKDYRKRKSCPDQKPPLHFDAMQ